MAIRLNAHKPTKKNAGLPSSKNGTVRLMRSQDVIKMPPTDALGIACLGDFELKPDAEFQYLYLTPKTQKYDINNTGDVDERLFKKKVSGSYPGNDLQIFEFVKNHINQGYIIVYKEDCEPYSKIFGSPKNPLFLSPNYKSDSTGKGFEITLEQNTSDNIPVLFFNGEFPVIIVDEGIIEIIDIIGQPIEGPYKSRRIYLLTEEPTGADLAQFPFPVIFRICVDGKTNDVTFDKDGNRFAAGSTGSIKNFPTFADLLIPGNIDTIYKALDTDELFIWDAETGTYLLSSIDNAWKTIVDQSIDGLQNSVDGINLELVTIEDKLNNLVGVDVNLQSQISAEVVERASQDAVLRTKINTEITDRANADDYLLGQINTKLGKTGMVDKMIHYYDSTLGKLVSSGLKFVAGAINQLEFTGRLKVDALILPNNSNTAVANRLRNDNNRLKFADGSAVEKDIAYLTDISSRLIKTYTHSGQQEIYISAIDYTTGYVTTTVPHGLLIGTFLTNIGLFTNGFAINSTRVNNARAIPYEYRTNNVFLRVIDANTISLRSSTNTVIAVNTALFSNSGFLDISKWHIEILSDINLTGLSQGLTKFDIEIYGMGASTNTTNQRNFSAILYNEAGTGEISVPIILGNGFGLNPCRTAVLHTSTISINTNHNLMSKTGFENTFGGATDDAIYASAYLAVSGGGSIAKNLGIKTFTGKGISNGSIVSIYV